MRSEYRRWRRGRPGRTSHLGARRLGPSGKFLGAARPRSRPTSRFLHQFTFNSPRLSRPHSSPRQAFKHRQQPRRPHSPAPPTLAQPSSNANRSRSLSKVAILVYPPLGGTTPFLRRLGAPRLQHARVRATLRWRQQARGRGPTGRPNDLFSSAHIHRKTLPLTPVAHPRPSTLSSFLRRLRTRS